MPKRLTDEQRFAQAALTRQTLDVASAVLAGRMTRAEAKAWADSVPPVQGTYGWRFHGHGAAETLMDCLQSPPTSGDTRYRDLDLAEWARRVREGVVHVEPKTVCYLRLPVAEIARRAMGTEVFRYEEDGLGLHEGTRFGSPSSGRAYMATQGLLQGWMRPEPKREVSEVYTWGWPDDAQQRSDVVVDLFDTLGVDEDDCEIKVGIELPMWEIRRVDDNGNEFLVTVTTGYTKAQNRVADLERLAHKQHYWVVGRQA